MPILERIRRIARANIQQWLDQAETPEDEVAAKIAELESAAREAKDALAGFAVTYKRLEKNVADLVAAHDEWQARAEAALQHGDEPAARLALGERIRAEERVAALTPVLESRRKTYDELKDNLLGIHNQLNLARSRLLDLRARRQAAAAEKAMGRQMDTVERCGADGVFERLEHTVAGAEAEAEIDRELRGALTPLGETIAKRESARKVDAELAALKRTLAGGGAANPQPQPHDQSQGQPQDQEPR